MQSPTMQRVVWKADRELRPMTDLPDHKGWCRGTLFAVAHRDGAWFALVLIDDYPSRFIEINTNELHNENHTRY